MKALTRSVSLMLVICALLLVITSGQQTADPNFNAQVAKPAYPKTHPKVLFDEAHNNFHTAHGRYKPFADLITNDGYSVAANKEKFQKTILSGYDVLIVVNALGSPRQNDLDAGKPAFTEEECNTVSDWVRAGGNLLFIADHAPFGSAAEILAKRFGVDMGKGHTRDSSNFDKETGNMSFLVFSRQQNTLPDHAIIRGRDATERIEKVLTFTGQSLKGPENSFSLLRLGDSAADVTRSSESEKEQGQILDHLPDGTPLPPGARVRVMPGADSRNRETSAAGRSQGLAFEFGKGRVVVLAEAGMLSAQVVKGPGAQLLGKEEFQMGMNRKDSDNRQFGLNVMHWLSRLLN